jgi:hypothetical protein
LDENNQPIFIINQSITLTFTGFQDYPNSLCPGECAGTFNHAFTFPGPHQIIVFNPATEDCRIFDQIDSDHPDLDNYCDPPPGGGFTVVGFTFGTLGASAAGSSIVGFISANNGFFLDCTKENWQQFCGGAALQLQPLLPGDFCDISGATATIQLGGGGGGGGFGGAIAPTHDVELSAFQIEPLTCPACNQVNGDFLFPGVYLNGIDTQSFAAPAGENAVCNNNDHLGWHWTVRPVDNPGLTAELRRYTVTESGAFESVLAIYEYNGGVADWLQGSPATLSLKTPLPPDPDNLCRYLSSWVTLTATPLQ